MPRCLFNEMEAIREKKRVCYIESKPEWFSYAVMRLFYRKPAWLFVPLRDISDDLKKEEYKKSSYFFVSGYGQAEYAQSAYENGCVLVGVRADVNKGFPIIECGEWDVIGAYGLIRFGHLLLQVPPLCRPLFVLLVKVYSKILWYPQFIFRSIRTENLRSIIVKTKKFLKIS